MIAFLIFAVVFGTIFGGVLGWALVLFYYAVVFAFRLVFGLLKLIFSGFVALHHRKIPAIASGSLHPETAIINVPNRARRLRRHSFVNGKRVVS